MSYLPVLLAASTLAACRPTSSLGTDPRGSAPARTGAARQLAYARRAEYQAQARAERVEPPLGLEPSDGAELALSSLRATVEITGPLAHTELHFSFKNTEQRQREGRFRIELPDGAAVSRFAMLVGREWREARVVSREQGRQVYETFLHQRVDPALLEQDLGNQFSARVFPIAPSADKEIVIGYDHAVSATRPYTLALRGLPAIPKLAVVVERDGERTVTEQRDVVPEDLVIGVEPGELAIAGGGAFVARVDLPGGAPAGDPARAFDRTLILVDTSASRHTVMGKQADLVHSLVAALGGAEVAVATYDQTVTEIYRGPATSADLANRLFEHGALGSSNLGAALTRAAGSGMRRLILVGDGVVTQGEASPAALAAVIRASGLERVDAIQVGGSLARDTLAPVVAAGKLPGVIVEGRDLASLVAALASPVPPELPIEVTGATAVWPKTTRGAISGRPLFVSGRGSGPLAIRIGTRTIRLQPRAVAATRVTRAAGRAELAELAELRAIARTDAQRAELDRRIEQVALANNLLSSRTSLLVLESDADEARMLGTAPPRRPGEAPPREGTGEVIRLTGHVPTIDHGSTSQGITIDDSYLKNIPIAGRTFEAALGASAGSQGDGRGVYFSGSSSLENRYVVDGAERLGTVATDTLSPLGLDHIAGYLRSNAFAFGLPEQRAPQAPATQQTVADAMPYVDELAGVMTALAAGDRRQAIERAARWQTSHPGDLAALIGLGEALEAAGERDGAARAYGSIIDLYPGRFELARAAGERFDRLGRRELAVDAYRRALADRPDQLATYRLLAFALLRAGRAGEAFQQLVDARKRAHTSVREVLLQDARVIAAHLVAADPRRRAVLEAALGAPIATTPSLHVVLGWETDANDVDLHIVDRFGDHAFYSRPRLASGGKLLEDLTDGYGPEMFSIDRPSAFPYSIAVHYYNRGAMGLGIGTVQVIRHDGKGTITVEDRPFVLQKDGVTIPLGEIASP